jgi:hypothetical protein
VCIETEPDLPDPRPRFRSSVAQSLWGLDPAAFRSPTERSPGHLLLTRRINDNRMFISLGTAECEWHALFATRLH